MNYSIVLLSFTGDKSSGYKPTKRQKMMLMKDRSDLIAIFRKQKSKHLFFLSPEAKLVSGEFAEFLNKRFTHSSANGILHQVESIRLRVLNKMENKINLELDVMRMVGNSLRS